MRPAVYTIISNQPLATRTYRMCLQGPTDGIRAGQFVEIAVPGFYLRRPISVCDAADGVLTLIYKVVGGGTDAMARLQPGTTLDLLIGLGNGYDLARAGHTPLLVGGGVGIPPLYLLAKQLRAQGLPVRVILGFNTRDEVFLEEAFRALGCDVDVRTADGSYGAKGLVTDALTGEQSYYYACGPLPMLRALIDRAGTHGEVSMEERMGCGFGICMGCTIETRDGNRRVCKEGPVFRADALYTDPGH